MCIQPACPSRASPCQLRQASGSTGAEALPAEGGGAGRGGEAGGREEGGRREGGGMEGDR